MFVLVCLDFFCFGYKKQRTRDWIIKSFKWRIWDQKSWNLKTNCLLVKKLKKWTWLTESVSKIWGNFGIKRLKIGKIHETLHPFVSNTYAGTADKVVSGDDSKHFWHSRVWAMCSWLAHGCDTNPCPTIPQRPPSPRGRKINSPWKNPNQIWQTTSGKGGSYWWGLRAKPSQSRPGIEQFVPQFVNDLILGLCPN